MDIFSNSDIVMIIYSHLSSRSLLVLISCDKFLNRLQNHLIMLQCNQKYEFEKWAIKYHQKGWKYTICLLKYQCQEIPVIINLCDNGKPKLNY